MYNKYAIHYDATKNSSFFHCKDTKTQRKKYILLIINSLRLGAFAVRYYWVQSKKPDFIKNDGSRKKRQKRKAFKF